MLLKRLQMKREELFAFAELLSENNPEENLIQSGEYIPIYPRPN